MDMNLGVGGTLFSSVHPVRGSAERRVINPLILPGGGNEKHCGSFNRIEAQGSGQEEGPASARGGSGRSNGTGDRGAGGKRQGWKWKNPKGLMS